MSFIQILVLQGECPKDGNCQKKTKSQGFVHAYKTNILLSVQRRKC